MSQRQSLTDEQWNRIKCLIPVKPGDRGRSGKDYRFFVDACTTASNDLTANYRSTY